MICDCDAVVLPYTNARLVAAQRRVRRFYFFKWEKSKCTANQAAHSLITAKLISNNRSIWQRLRIFMWCESVCTTLTNTVSLSARIFSVFISLYWAFAFVMLLMHRIQFIPGFRSRLWFYTLFEASHYLYWFCVRNNKHWFIQNLIEDGFVAGGQCFHNLFLFFFFVFRFSSVQIWYLNRFKHFCSNKNQK